MKHFILTKDLLKFHISFSSKFHLLTQHSAFLPPMGIMWVDGYLVNRWVGTYECSYECRWVGKWVDR